MKFHEWTMTQEPPYSENAKESLAFMLYGWMQEVRPYYKVWPAITSALQKLSLDVKLCDLSLKPRAILLRFAVGQEPEVDGVKFLWVLSSSIQWEDCDSFHVEYRGISKHGFVFGIDWLRTTEDGTIEKVLANAPESPMSQGGLLVRLAYRMGPTAHLLAEDPSIVSPDVLAKDRDRYSSEKDEGWKERAVDRARRRGVVGWNIGADYEVCPHYRRPHLGIRHTGKGRTIPRIVPIKGAVVHRNRMTQVPTGYTLPDGTEIEGGKVVQ